MSAAGWPGTSAAARRSRCARRLRWIGNSISSRWMKDNSSFATAPLSSPQAGPQALSSRTWRRPASRKRAPPSWRRRSSHTSIRCRHVLCAVLHGRTETACASSPDHSFAILRRVRPRSQRLGYRMRLWRRRTAWSRPNFSGRRSIVPPAMLAPTTGRTAASTRRHPARPDVGADRDAAAPGRALRHHCLGSWPRRPQTRCRGCGPW